MRRESGEHDGVAGPPVPAPADATRSVATSEMNYLRHRQQHPEQQAEQEAEEYLFELAPLGPEDLLSRCREGPGNWWGDAEECLRVDERGRVVLVDPEMYYEHHYTQRNYIRIAVSVLCSVLSGRSLGKPSNLTPQLVEHLARVWHRPRRPLTGVVSDAIASSSLAASGGDGVVAVALGRRVANIPLRPWAKEAAIMAPRLGRQMLRNAGRGDEDSRHRRPSDEGEEEDNRGLNLHGQVLAWNVDGSVVAVSTPAGGIACLSNPSGGLLATIAPRSSYTLATGGDGGGSGGGAAAANLGAGIAGVALRGASSPVSPGCGKMEVLVLTFDAVLAVYSFPIDGGRGGQGDNVLASPVCEQRLGRWHTSTCAMAFHAATDTVAVAGPSGASRSSSSLSLTLWRISGGASSSSSSSFDEHTARADAGTSSGTGTRSRSRRPDFDGSGGGGGGPAKTPTPGIPGPGVDSMPKTTTTTPTLSELHFVALEGGSLVVPAPRAGLDRAPPGTVPALLPLFFPGLRAVAPPVEVAFNPSGNRLAVLDIAGGVTVVETSKDAASTSVHGRRCISADGRSWRRDTGDASAPSPPEQEPAEGGEGLSQPNELASTAGTAAPAGAGGTGAGVPRAVSVGWWSDSTLAAMSSTGDLAHNVIAGGRSGPRPPPLGPRCTVWFAGDGRRAAEAVEGRVRRGLLGEALDLAVACGLDAGGVRAALWLRAIGGGLFSADDVEQHLVGVSDHRWVAREAVRVIGLAATEPAACALLREGLRRCRLLLLPSGEDKKKGGDAEETAVAGSTAVDGDGWDFDDEEDDDSGGSSSGTAEAEPGVSIPSAVEGSDGGVGRTYGGGSSGNARGGDDRGARGAGAEVLLLVARLESLRYLLETFLEAEGAQGRRYDVASLGKFLALSTVPEALGGAVAGSGAQKAWEDAECRRIVLQRSLMEFARKGEAAAVGVLLERHPVETLPARLDALRSAHLPLGIVCARVFECVSSSETVKARYLLKIAGPLHSRYQNATRWKPRVGIFAVLGPGSSPGRTLCAEGGAFHVHTAADAASRHLNVTIGRYAEKSLLPSCGPPPTTTAAAASAAPGAGSSKEDAAMAVATEGRHDPAVLAAWYAARARELDARAGQLRHAATMCHIGVDRVGVVGGRENGDATAVAAAVQEEVEGLVRLDRLLRHLASLVYAGSVSPSITLAAWEGMGLEDRISAVLAASSAKTVVEDVRVFARAAAAGDGGEGTGGLAEGARTHEADSSDALSSHTAHPAVVAVPSHLEGMMVRVLGTLVKAGPSAERMEVCAAVAKASRPEVPENERLIRRPEALLTLLLEACYAWTETSPDERAMEAAWELLECVPTRQDDVDGSLQDRADALEGHLYSTQVLRTYGLAPPLTRYLEMGGGAEGTADRDAERYNAFARRLVDQMCAVAMDRAGMGWADHNNSGGDGKSRRGVGRIWRRGTEMVGARGGGVGSGGRGGLNAVGRQEITRLHKDVSRLQSNAWQGLGARWAIRRVLQAVVEAGQFDVAKALVESSAAAPVAEGGRGGAGAGSAADGAVDDETEAKRLERRAIAEDVLLSAAVAHFNSAPSFDDGEELRASKRWLDLLPWSSPALDRERRLHTAGSLAHDLGATDLVPLQLRLHLYGERAGTASVDGVARDPSGKTSASSSAPGAMEVIREVLRCNPDAFRDGEVETEGGDGGSWVAGGGGGAGSNDGGLFGGGTGALIRTPPGTALLRLAGLLGLHSGGDIDRVRALVATAALDGGDGGAACDILSAAILRRPPRGAPGRGQEGEGGPGVEEGTALPFTPELCEALDLVALSRCPASQIGRLLGPWSRFEAVRFASGAATPLSAASWWKAGWTDRRRWRSAGPYLSVSLGGGRGAGPVRTAEGALRLLLLREPDEDLRRKATNRLCILLALTELGSDEAIALASAAAATPRVFPRPADCDGDRDNNTGISFGGVRATSVQGDEILGRAHGAAEQFGVGPVERAVGYALAATDGRAALGALRALLEQAEGRVKALREEAAGVGGGGAGERAGGAEGGEVGLGVNAFFALHKRGISLNRARRACAATRNASREAALAWCVEHSADAAMDAPFIPTRRLSASGRLAGSAARSRGMAAAALEAYVRARLSAIGKGGGGGGVGVGGAEAVPPEEVRELEGVLRSFRRRQSLGQAEDRARGILPASVDLGRFAADERYRQSPRDVLALARQYTSVDTWAVAASAATSLLGPSYAKLRRLGIPAPNAADKGGGGGGSLLQALFDGAPPERDLLELARAAFIGAADGQDLHHLDLLLSLMMEAAARPRVTGGPGGGGGGGGKSPVERRLGSHCGLVRRLLKAAPPGLDYKALIGEDPLADPLADPADAAATARGTPAAPSVAGLEHAPALSKLAARMPGMSGSAVYLAVAQRVLCGETGGLSPEALEFEEAEAAAASVYHLLAPLLQKMTPEDLVGLTAAVCAPHAVGAEGGLGRYPCRRPNQHHPQTVAPSTTAPTAAGPFQGRMEPLHLTVRCRRRVTTAAAPSLEERLARLAGLLDALAAVPTRRDGPGTLAKTELTTVAAAAATPAKPGPCRSDEQLPRLQVRRRSSSSSARLPRR
ncbi:unnamed protein product [Scytosiphon promiscuus]